MPNVRLAWIRNIIIYNKNLSILFLAESLILKDSQVTGAKFCILCARVGYENSGDETSVTRTSTGENQSSSGGFRGG